MVKYIQYWLIFIHLVFAIDLKTEDVYDNSWALIIGINDYENVPDLHYAVEDALAIKNMLINEFNFSRNNVRVLIDKEATQSNINKEMSKLLKSAGVNDRVVFYFAGQSSPAKSPLYKSALAISFMLRPESLSIHKTNLLKFLSEESIT